ncbi:AMP-binding protein [Sphingomonas sp. 28-63-12]|uniref:AMP-binding protein n=1 Tax=Sphingomonas sp. 28-63-12 TaxID=1970434 RepID=UPI000BD04EE2|nr:MAG: hypothetical protein B7Y47_09735 [Sphingomonas sp. 28-63-12]
MTNRPTDPIRLHAAARPDHAAIVDLERGITLGYAALHRRIAQAVAVLAAEAIGVGDRVAVLARNRADYVVLHMACARLGAILVALNWRLTPAELVPLIADSEPALIIGDASIALLPDAVAAAHSLIDFDSFAARIDGATPDDRQGSDEDLPSLMLFTSGTSGQPKGALLSEKNLFLSSASFVMMTGVSIDSVFLCDSPLFHVLGLVTNVRAPLMVGGTVLISGGFDPATTLTRLSDPALRVSHYTCVPQMAEMLRRQPGFDPQKLKGLGVVTGGAPNPPPKIREWLADGIPLGNGYGMTETGSLCGMPLNIALIEQRIESAGPVTPVVELRIADAADQPMPPGAHGEIQIKGASLFSGYWRRPDANASAFSPDGFFRTGDVGRLDEAGYLYIALLAFPGLSEAAVVGVADPQWGEVGAAAVVLRDGVSATEADLHAHCAGLLARYKIPKRIAFMAHLPRNGAGKVLKADLRHHFMGG